MHSDSNNNNTYLVIMAGGIGSRFWPMSTPSRPKQFHDILGTGRTLFQSTVDRFRDLVPIENIYVVTADKYAGLVADQEPGIPSENILREPMLRNTAPCIAFAAYAIQAKNPDASMIVTPADHFVARESDFKKIVTSALTWLSSNDEALMTMGIAPDRPETGYGYIQTDGFKENDIVPVKQFREKPDLATALTYLKSGDYLWNSGIFLWKIKTIVQSFEEYLPEIHAIFSGKKVHEMKGQELFDTYEHSPNISIDYGVLERANNIYVVKADCGWSDLGTWGSLWQQENHDANGNSMVPGKTHLYDTKDCVIRVPADKEIIIEGLTNFIIVDDPDHLLIFRKDNEQLIGTYSKKLKD